MPRSDVTYRPLYKLGAKSKAALGSPDFRGLGFAFAVASCTGSVAVVERAVKGAVRVCVTPLCVLHLCVCIKFKIC